MKAVSLLIAAPSFHAEEASEDADVHMKFVGFIAYEGSRRNDKLMSDEFPLRVGQHSAATRLQQLLPFHTSFPGFTTSRNPLGNWGFNVAPAPSIIWDSMATSGQRTASWGGSSMGLQNVMHALCIPAALFKVPYLETQQSRQFWWRTGV